MTTVKCSSIKLFTCFAIPMFLCATLLTVIGCENAQNTVSPNELRPAMNAPADETTPFEDDGTYLFGLTANEILDTIAFYNEGQVDSAYALDAMRAPFDVTKFGSLGDEIEEKDAYRVLESAWQMALNRMPLDTILAETRAQRDAASDAWFNATYANGIPDNDPYWGNIVPNASVGSPSEMPMVIINPGTNKTTVKNADEDRKIKQRAGVSTFLFVTTASGEITYHKKVLGIWVRAKADTLELDVTSTAINGLGIVSVQTANDTDSNESKLRLELAWSAVLYSGVTSDSCGSATDSANPGTLAACEQYP